MLLASACIAMMGAFGWALETWQTPLLDSLWNPQRVSEQLERVMSDEAHRRQHILISTTLDVAFPIGVGGFLHALTRRTFKCPPWNWRTWPALAFILADLIEGGVHVAMLNSVAGLIPAKCVITMTKYALVNIAALIASFGLLAAIWRSSRAPK